ncbi:MG2 domain-containing protein [Leeuwenhoekiella parthenopeia]|uniref:Macroglobulin domain-containing protein n=1 Tax=Leeuwenhoekiella parthenopeia TaxID=2890320 RepID=A0ABS8GU53_9FLAO|nr:MG2 domain-containing protein [Leeuwenhoekiella parthenopeia]MCC4213190.1 hypothetical protein [Leeuwenhoekiella parthenopeia]
MHHVKVSKSPLPNFFIKFKTGLCAFIILITASRLTAQQDISAQEALAEKIYLQTDRKAYTPGETIWFKAIVAQAKDNVPSGLSGVLHVELIDPFETLVGEKMIKLNDGIGSNFFSVEDFYAPGTYQLRAYTQWNQNFDADFIFKTYLNIAEAKSPEPVVEKMGIESKDAIRFVFKPELIDSTAGNKFDLELAYGDQVKKRIIRKNGAGYFVLEENFAEDTDWVHFKILTESGKQYSESIPLSKPAIDIQFLPEGGSLLSGINNLIGFKAIDETGKGVAVSGTVYDDQGIQVTSFKSNELGMGRVYLFPKASTTYRVELTESNRDIQFTYSFPKVIEKGSTLSVNPVGTNLAVQVRSTQFVNDSVYVAVSSRGLALGEVGRKLESGKQNLVFSKESLPAGILVFTLKDQNKNPLAERLYFNHLETEALKLDIELNKPSFKTEEEVSLTLSATGLARDASASVLVIPNELKNEQNIWTYFMLSSELRGTIEKSAYYFEGTQLVKPDELDNLLLTQGWRGYTFNSSPDEQEMPFLPEFTLGVQGEIAALFDKDKMKEGVDVSLMVFGEEQQFYDQKTDSLGRFNFLLPPLEGRRVRAVLQTKNDAGKNRDYNLSLDEAIKPQITYDRNRAFFKKKEPQPEVLQKSEQKQTADTFFDYDPSINKLDEVLISDYKLTPQRKKVMDTYGKPDVVIDGREIETKANEYSHGLYGVLRQSFGDKISFQLYQDSTGVRYQKAVVTGGMETLVLVDGIPVLADAYQFLPNLPPSEVKSVEILDGTTQNFMPLYRRVYPFRSMLSTPTQGSILAIYTYSGNGFYTATKSKGILKTSIPLFAPTKAFYIPKYESGAMALGPGDNAVTLYWDPNISLQNGEPVNVKYPNNTIPGTKTVLVEVISPDGKIGYKTLDYEVEE